MLTLDQSEHYIVTPILQNGGTSHQLALLSVGGVHYIVDSCSTIRILKLTVCTLHVRFEWPFTCFVCGAMQAGALRELGCTHMTDPARSRKDSVDSCPLKTNGCIQVGLAQCNRKELNKVAYFLSILLGSVAVVEGSEIRGG